MISTAQEAASAPRRKSPRHDQPPAQEAASAPRRKGPRDAQHGTRGRVSPEAQGSSIVNNQ